MLEPRSLCLYARQDIIRILRNCSVRFAIECAVFSKIACTGTKDDIPLLNLVHFIKLEFETTERLEGSMNMLDRP
jgi:hypothetical protein